jgi:hypothetical protein
VYSLADASQQIAAGRWPVPASSITYLGHFTTLTSNQVNSITLRNIPQEYDDLLLYYDALSDKPNSNQSEDDAWFPIRMGCYANPNGTGSAMGFYHRQYSDRVGNGVNTPELWAPMSVSYDPFVGFSKAVDWVSVTGGPTIGWEHDTYPYTAFNELRINNYRHVDYQQCLVRGYSVQGDLGRLRISKSFAATYVGDTSYPIGAIRLSPTSAQTYLRIRILLYGVMR